MKPSKVVQSMQFSPIRKLTPLALKVRDQGVKVFPLNIGQPDVPTPEGYFEALKNIDTKVIAYTDSQGIPELIQAHIDYYKKWGVDFESEDLIITQGGSEALTFALTTLCDEGDEVIVPEPFYTNYNSFAQNSHVKLIPMVTKAETGFHLPPLEEIEKLISEKTKGILFSNPGNPTGVVYTKDEILSLCELAKKHDIALIADEVYREFTYDGEEYFSPLLVEGMDDHVILIDSVSKRFSACGARIGVLASKNKEFMQQALKLAQARLCAPLVEQIAAAKLFATDPNYFKEVNEEYDARRTILYDGLISIDGVLCEKPKGAFYIMLTLPIQDADDFARWMLEEFRYNNQTVLMAPGAGFYATEGLGKNQIRLSYCINQEELKLATRCLAEGIKAYVKEKEEK